MSLDPRGDIEGGGRCTDCSVGIESAISTSADCSAGAAAGAMPFVSAGSMSAVSSAGFGDGSAMLKVFFCEDSNRLTRYGADWNSI